ncbi:hypothetical protein ANCDUO_15783 [Ancylostoma duodenale]|uniref:Immunoglobulin I-set domain-containing protein n=1 Tax=Ancylostoma duodenale TaxID=51022 RepID=A0A0C2CW25_9BILA|nr:hypothetical protein ANCDUO_15783 [Ancylostoma duodenale]
MTKYCPFSFPQYQLIGTSLAVRNVLPSDAGFYHCIAKSEAGQAIGNRRLLVDREFVNTDTSHSYAYRKR